MSVILEIDKITKEYFRGSKSVKALRSLSFSVQQGGVFGLLGPNGAGKSTLLRIVLDLIRPTSGQCRLFGLRVDQHPGILRRVGGLIETTRLYPFLSGAETLDVLARTSGVRLRRPDRDRLLWRVGLTEAGGRRIGEYSLGMKQRLGVASTLIGSPELVILDEPTNGLDPTGIQDMRALIRELVVRDGVTVILSSHQLDEVQRLCDHVAIIDKGELVANGTLSDLLGREYLLIDAEPHGEALSALGACAEPVDDRIKVAVSRTNAPSLLRDLIQRGVKIYEAKWIAGSLEELFISQTESRRNDR